jgi:hypothetical protein
VRASDGVGRGQSPGGGIDAVGGDGVSAAGVKEFGGTWWRGRRRLLGVSTAAAACQATEEKEGEKENGSLQEVSPEKYAVTCDAITETIVQQLYRNWMIGMSIMKKMVCSGPSRGFYWVLTEGEAVSILRGLMDDAE